jgi:hypothetical protein
MTREWDESVTERKEDGSKSAWNAGMTEEQESKEGD